MHFEYRKGLGDTRKWGSPWNIFLLPDEIKQKGDTLIKSAPIVSGELIEAEAEKFIRAVLKLPAEELKTGKAMEDGKGVEPCDDGKPVQLQKPKK